MFDDLRSNSGGVRLSCVKSSDHGDERKLLLKEIVASGLENSDASILRHGDKQIPDHFFFLLLSCTLTSLGVMSLPFYLYDL